QILQQFGYVWEAMLFVEVCRLLGLSIMRPYGRFAALKCCSTNQRFKTIQAVRSQITSIHWFGGSHSDFFQMPLGNFRKVPGPSFWDPCHRYFSRKIAYILASLLACSDGRY